MQIPLVFDALLLFALSFPVVMKYRILPIEGTPYWLFGVLFLLLVVNIVISFYDKVFSKFAEITSIRRIILWTVLAIVIGGTTVTAIIDRHKVAPVWGVHDIILQQEAAIRYLVHGKNPYKETYFGTPLADFTYEELGKPAVNPALYHFVMPPWYLVFPLPFYVIANHTVGYFDGRMVLLVCFVVLLYILSRWFRNRQIATIAIIFTALSPGIVDYFIEGRSDLFALFWLVLSVYLMHKKTLALSAVSFAFALLSKQTTWFAVPFVMVGFWKGAGGSYKKIIWYSCLIAAIVLFVAGPFFLWDPKAFLDSIIFYLSGNTGHAYPISGYGFGMVLFSMGIVKNIHDYYPFLWWQILFGLPILVFLLRLYWQKPKESGLLVGYAISLFVFWYFSRYLNNSHLGYISSLLVLGVLKSWDEEVSN